MSNAAQDKLIEIAIRSLSSVEKVDYDALVEDGISSEEALLLAIKRRQDDASAA